MPSDLVNQIIASEEIAREQEAVLKERIKKFRTNIVDWKDFLPDEKNYSFLDKEGEGKIEEVVIISPSSNFSLFVEVDGVIAYQGDYSRFEDISMHVDSIVAQQRGATYVLQISDVVFLSRVRVVIDVGESITFQRLYCKYQLEV